MYLRPSCLRLWRLEIDKSKLNLKDGSLVLFMKTTFYVRLFRPCKITLILNVVKLGKVYLSIIKNAILNIGYKYFVRIKHVSIFIDKVINKLFLMCIDWRLFKTNIKKIWKRENMYLCLEALLFSFLIMLERYDIFSRLLDSF